MRQHLDTRRITLEPTVGIPNMPTSVSETPWSLEGSAGETIFGDAHLPDGTPRGTLLIAHGFKGYKDYGFMPMLAQRAVEAGFQAHRFNFSHSGMTRDTETFQRPDLFERDTWGRQVHDLLTVHRAARDGRLPGAAARKSMLWFGHSRGGVTCLLASARLAAAEAPAGVITAASPSTTLFLDADQQALLRRSGRIESPSSRTGQTLYIGRDLLDEIDQNPRAFDPTVAASHLCRPLLVIHGKNDQTVPLTAADQLAEAAGSHGHRHVVPDASHTFNAPNPLDPNVSPPKATAEMIGEVLAFAGACVDPAAT